MYRITSETVNESSTTFVVSNGEDNRPVYVGTNYPDNGAAWIQVDGATIQPHAPHTRAGRIVQPLVDWFDSLPSEVQTRVYDVYEYWAAIGRIYDAAGNTVTMEAANKAMDNVAYPAAREATNVR